MPDPIEAAARAIQRHVQFNDFGRLDENDEFHTSSVQIDLLEAVCREAARAAIEAYEAEAWRPIVEWKAEGGYFLMVESLPDQQRLVERTIAPDLVRDPWSWEIFSLDRFERFRPLPEPPKSKGGGR